MKIVDGTRPIPKKNPDIQAKLVTWEDTDEWEPLLAQTMTDETIRKAYGVI